MFLVEFRADEASPTFDWQVYCPPCEGTRGSNIRVRFVILPALTGGPTVIQLLLVITVPLGYIHCTTGRMPTSTVQVRLKVFPDTAVPDTEMVTVCWRSGEVGRLKGIAPEKSYSACDCVNWVLPPESAIILMRQASHYSKATFHGRMESIPTSLPFINSLAASSYSNFIIGYPSWP